MARWISLVVVLLIAALVAAGTVVSSRSRVLYRTAGQVLALDAGRGTVIWLERSRADSDGSPALATGPSRPEVPGGHLLALGPKDRTPRCLYAEDRLVAARIAGSRLLALELAADGVSGALIDVPLEGGAPKPLASALMRPQAVTVDSSAAYWTEATPALMPHVWHLPVVQPRVVLRSVSLNGGEARTLGVAEGSGLGFQGDLLGVTGGTLYWVDRAAVRQSWGWSVVRGTPLAGGPSAQIRIEQGPQTGVLTGADLYWTGPSEDAGNPMGWCCVRRASPAGAEPITVTDWVWASGGLCATGGRVYYGCLEGTFTIPKHLAKPALWDRSMVSNGLVAGDRGGLYRVSPGMGKSNVVYRAATLVARLRAVLGAR